VTDREPTALTDPAEPAEQAGSIGRKAGRGLRWALLSSLATRVGSFAMSLVLARLLTPVDFGLYAVALAATAFVMHVNDVGIIAATVQWRGKLEDMAPTATTLALVFSAGWYTVFWMAAPAYAALAGSPEATPVVRLLTAVILIDGLTAVRVAALQRRFQHDKLTIAIATGFVANATLAITLAANGAGPFSFVWGQLAASVVTAVLVLSWARVPFRLGIDRAIAAKLVRFGVPLAAGLGVESILLYADSVIVGNVLGAVALGFYLLAFNVSSWVPGLVSTAIRWVSIPSFSRLAEQSRESLAEGVRRSMAVLLAAVLPVAVLIGTLAPSLVGFLYGQQWSPSADVLRFLAISMVARVLINLVVDILISIGATRATLVQYLCWAAVLVPAVVVGTRLDGIRGAAIAHAGVAMLVAVPLAVLALHRAGVRLGPALPLCGRPLLGGALSLGVTAGLAVLVPAPALAQLGLAGGAGLVTYLLVVVPAAQLRRLGTRALAFAAR
jgi:PST family polysaccharide transporter